MASFWLRSARAGCRLLLFNTTDCVAWFSGASLSLSGMTSFAEWHTALVLCPFLKRGGCKLLILNVWFLLVKVFLFLSENWAGTLSRTGFPRSKVSIEYVGGTLRWFNGLLKAERDPRGTGRPPDTLISWFLSPGSLIESWVQGPGMLKPLGQSKGDCMGVCVGVYLEVRDDGLGRSPPRRRVSALGEEGNRPFGRGIPDEAGGLEADFTLPPPFIVN